jgi:hypothetical protein
MNIYCFRVFFPRNYCLVGNITSPNEYRSIKINTFAEMNRKLKAISALILCGLFLYNSMGYMVVSSVNRMILRKQVSINLWSIPDYKLTTITVPKNNQSDFFNKSIQPEIKVDGQMYDVVRYKDNGKSITYICVRDQKEERMIKKSILLTDQSKNSNPGSKASMLILDQIIKSALLSEKLDLKILSTTILFSDNSGFLYSNPILPVAAPPPQA